MTHKTPTARAMLFALAFAIPQIGLAVDATYYSDLDGKSDSDLRTALTSLTTSKHTTTLGYDWTFDGIDIVDGTLEDIYSTCNWSTTGSDQCGVYSSVCDCYNREHVVPQSLFNEVSPQKGDRHHLFLTDGKVNNQRSNYPFGECSSGTSLGSKALGKLGTSTFSGYTSSVGTVFEPDDKYKGDIARAIMYMAIRYATVSSYPVTSWSRNAMFSGSLSTNYGLSAYAVALLMQWHRQDPVSQKEITRNNGVADKQGNRNPFIDYPCLAEYLWGEKAGKTFSTASCCGSFDANFSVGSDGCTVCSTDPIIYSVADQPFAAAPSATATQTITVKGANLTGDLTLALSGTNADLFTLSATTATQADATSGLSVTITYAPTAVGTHTATITISGGGATDVTVTLTGECTDSGDSGNDNTGGSNAPAASALLMVGKPIVLENVKKNDIVCTGTTRLQVHISDLATSVNVTSSDTGVFTVDKASITPDEASEGVTLTLTKVASGTATLTISGGVINQTIDVTCE